MISTGITIRIDQPPSRARVAVWQKLAQLKLALIKAVYLGNYLIMVLVMFFLAMNGAQHHGKMLIDVVLLAVFATGNSVMQKLIIMLAIMLKNEVTMFQYVETEEKDHARWGKNHDAANYLAKVYREERPLMRLETVVLDAHCGENSEALGMSCRIK